MTHLRRQAEVPKSASRPEAAVPGIRSRPAFGVCIWIAIALCAPFVLSRTVASKSALFDLVANVSYFTAFPLLCVAVFAVVLGRWWAVCVALSAAAVVAYPILSLSSLATITATSSKARASIIFCNIHGNASAWKSLREIIGQRHPDIVAIVEADDAVVERIVSDEEIGATYAYRVIPMQGLEWPQIVLSRHPMKPLQLNVGPPGTRLSSLFSSHRSYTIALPVGDVIFSAEHVPSPRTNSAWELGNSQIRALGELVRYHLVPKGVPLMIAGDFNTSPAGYRDHLIRSETGLHPDPETFLPVGTWPSDFPPFLRLPLDRIWGSEKVVFLSREVLADIGSDHRPICVSFCVMP